jgi:hypothetical protein
VVVGAVGNKFCNEGFKLDEPWEMKPLKLGLYISWVLAPFVWERQVKPVIT